MERSKEMASFYGKLSAEVYDLDKYIGKSYGDVEYYYDRLKDVKGKILEPAVGNGRILIPLLEQGLDVEGFDLSNDMLDLCKRNGDQAGFKPNIYKLNMANFSLTQKYAAVIVPTGSFLLLHKREESVAALQCFYDHLEAGGKLIVDIFLPDTFKKGYVSKRTMHNPEGDMITLEETLVEVEPIHQFSIFHNKYEKWSEDKLIDSELEIFPLKWYGVEEFRLTLEKIGFKNIIVSSDYKYNQYPTKADDIITFEAIRP